MKNAEVRIKLRQRLNKLASNDFTNLECWQEAELLNKAQLQVVRRIIRDKDESTKTSLNDIQMLLETKDMKVANKKQFFESELLPENYLDFKKVIIEAYRPDCEKVKRIRCFLSEEGNAEFLLNDELRSPSFTWGETFVTIMGNKLKIWTNEDFIVKKCELVYYRYPKKISFSDCRDFDNRLMDEVEMEFKDDLIEIIIDEAVSIAAADMGDYTNFQRQKQSVLENS